MQTSLLNQDIIKTRLGDLANELEATQSALNHLHNDSDIHQTSTTNILEDAQVDIGRLKLTNEATHLQLDLMAGRLELTELGIDHILRVLTNRQHHNWDPYWFAACVMLAIVCITQFAIIRFSGTVRL